MSPTSAENNRTDTPDIPLRDDSVYLTLREAGYVGEDPDTARARLSADLASSKPPVSDRPLTRDIPTTAVKTIPVVPAPPVELYDQANEPDYETKSSVSRNVALSL